MKKYQQTNRGKSTAHLFGSNRQLPLRFYGAMEPLEQRHMLAANVLDSTIGTIETSTDTDAVQMIVSLPGSSDATASLVLHMNARNGSAVDSIAPLVLDGDGDVVPSTRMNNANGLNAQTVVELGAGTYTVVADGQAGSTGQYELVASLLGDVETDDGSVSDFERLRTSAAMVQYLGTGNFVTNLFYETRGIDMGVDQYDAGMDANANGAIEPSDFAMVESNSDLSFVGVQFFSDSDPPEFSDLALVNPVDAQGRVPDATITGRVTDEVGVMQLLASLDSDPLQDVTAQVSIAGDGTFTISQALLDSLAGGTLANGEHTLNLRAVDELDNENDPPVEFDFNLFRNNPPVIAPIPDQPAEEDVLFQFDIGGFVSDTDEGDSTTIAVTQSDGDDGNIPINSRGLPAWLSFDMATGILSGTPAESDVGSFTVSVFAVDESGTTDVESFSVTVQDTNDDPMLVMEIENQIVAEETPFSLDISSNFSDPDVGDQLTYSLVTDASWLSIDAITGVISGVADDADIGLVDVTVNASDRFGATVSDTFEVTVTGVEEAPVVEDQSFVADPTGPNGTVFGTVEATDEDAGDTLTFEITGGTGASFFAIDADTGQLSIADSDSLNEDDEFELTVTVTDSTGRFDTAIISILVTSNLDPTAVDDEDQSTTDVDPLVIPFDDVLGNDTDPDGDTLTVMSVSATSAEGATVTLGDDGIVYDPTSVDALVELAEGDSIVDTFTYTISDGRGGTDSATVSVTVNGTGPDVQFILRTFDAEGVLTTAVDPGDTFELRVFVQDISAAGNGVFSAFLDVTYTNLATPGDIVHSSDYGGAPSGSTATSGLLDEVGGVDGITPLGDGEIEVFRIEFTAGMDDGFLVFNSNPAEDDVQHPVLLFGESTNTLNGQIEFGTTSVAIGAVMPLSAGDASAMSTNPANPFDVNDDSQVSPLDALMVINYLAGMDSGSDIYVDVNGDTVGSPMDALLVINEMTSETIGLPLSSGTITGDDGSSIPVDDLFAALADDSIELGGPWDDVVDFLHDNSSELVNDILSQLDDETDPEELADWNDWIQILQGLV